MATLNTSLHAPETSPGPNGAPAEANKRDPSRSEFPIRLGLNITPAMAASLGRLRRRMKLKEAVIGRLALMNWLASQDREYREDD